MPMVKIMTFSIIAASVSILSIASMLLFVETVNASHDPNIPPGGNWAFNANGYPTILSFVIDSTGKVSGSVYGNPIIGFWDDIEHKILFMRMVNENPASFQIYKGYMFEIMVQPNVCIRTLAGEFLTPAGAGGTPQRNEYGWIAQDQGVTPCEIVGPQ